MSPETYNFKPVDLIQVHAVDSSRPSIACPNDRFAIRKVLISGVPLVRARSRRHDHPVGDAILPEWVQAGAETYSAQRSISSRRRSSRSLRK